MGELLSVLRAEEKENKALRFEKYLLILIVLILITCTLVMISDIRRLQGTARIVNYAGIVRGATQRLVKLEMNGFTNQVLEDRINNIIFGLKNGSETPAASSIIFLLFFGVDVIPIVSTAKDCIKIVML